MTGRGICWRNGESNRYDGEGLRYETEENGKVIRFLFDRGELAQENREDEKISYVRGHRAISLSRSGKDRNYFVQDEMGSTLFLLDQNHEIRKTYRYDAFGNLLKETGDIPNRLTYTGQIYDGAAIQYYLRARFYNPAIGRFIQEDTYRGDGLNLYAYCANNPVIYFDPSGHIGLCPIGKVDQYKVDDPLADSRLKEIYKKWIADGISDADAMEYLRRFGGRPDVEYLPYIDKYTKEAYAYVQGLSDEELLSARQLEVLKSEPYLRDAFIGSEIDKKFKVLIRTGGQIPIGTYEIVPIGADLYILVNGERSSYWIEITT